MRSCVLDFLTLLQDEASGASRRVLADRAQSLSSEYRRFAPSQRTIRAIEDVLAYALTRAPATLAVLERVFREIAELSPEFSPLSLLDLGAGPGTASWAALGRFPTIARAELVDANIHFLDLAASLARRSSHPALVSAEIVRADLVSGPGEAADLVVIAYALTELEDEARYLQAVEAAWTKARDVLVIVEPGRPRDYTRLMAARQALIRAGAAILAPCPHARECPLTPPDWCHFAQRLNRSRDHRLLKAGALAYEDEKYSYVIAMREPQPSPAWSRVLAPVETNKFATELKLCTPEGLKFESVSKRSGRTFKQARKLGWGDRTDDGKPGD